MKNFLFIAKIFIALLLFNKILGFGFFLNSSNNNADEKVNVAIVLPLTGNDAPLGNKMLQSAMLVLNNSINENIKVNVYDTASSTNNFNKIAREIESNNDKIILGPITSTDTLELIKALKNNSVETPVLSFSNNVQVLDSQVSNTFLMGYLLESEIKRAIEFLVFRFQQQQKILKLAIFAPNNQYGNIMVKEANKVANVYETPIKIVTYPENEIRLNNYFAKLIPSSALNKYLTQRNEIKANKFYDDPELGRIIKAVPPTLDFNALIILEYGRRLPYVTSLLPAFDISAKDVDIMGLSTWNSSFATKDDNLRGAFFVNYKQLLKNTDFYNLYSGVYKVSPSLLESVAYDSMNIVLDLVQKHKVTHISSTNDVLFLLQSNTWQGVLGNFKLLSSGYNSRDLGVVNIVNSQTLNYVDK